MTKMTVPKIGVDDNLGLRTTQERSVMERIVRARAIGSENLAPAWVVLHRETNMIEFKRNIISCCKLTNGNNISYKIIVSHEDEQGERTT
jgi:hypothetical protein